MNPLRLTAAFLALALLLVTPAAALAAAPPDVVFATAEQGRAVLTQRDDFVERLSPFDRAARLKRDSAVSEREFLSFVGANVADWNAAQSQRVTTALDTVRENFRASKLTFPAGIMLIHTTGKEEGGAAYTRASAIVLPTGVLADKDQDLVQVLSHELFHVISRREPRLRDRLYRSIGFEACPEFVFPAALADRRITNPDAPRNDHRIKVDFAGQQIWAIPVLYADSAYTSNRGGEFFNYLQFRLALSEPELATRPAGGEPRFVEVKALQGFFEQVGRNTQYLIHPEEILADNFAIAIAGKADVPTPSVPQQILRIMHEAVAAVGNGRGAATAAPGHVARLKD